ncbi:RNA helicase Ecym_7009 [Eremothecium cymbalariae DBVPG|uniref:RNA helicase n=1 Tax=Eremothecium cymbalariae (strain CBS 270.75 / DBVPG 7215 / KCTC 17166 / NRRL Y-17582) TaxID=931890 RepID=G8JVK2_ERECY|nr:hypothetical protein Ecym_7009 [Eremothecium cymbalariae DBVPG\
MAKKSTKGKSATPPTEDFNANDKKGKKGKDLAAAEEKKLKHRENRAKVTNTSSWTGKLPHTLLYEVAQKRKWNKVEYEMKKIGTKGMLSIACVSYTDPKSKETVTVRMNDPTYNKTSGMGLLIPQETAIEARNYAATVALYRIAYNTNMHMMLPSNHKKLWHELDDYRKQLLKENPARCSKVFDVDPLKTLLEEQKLTLQKEAKREVRKQQDEKIRKAPVIVTSVNKKNISTSLTEGKVIKPSKPEGSSRVVKFSSKVWESSTFADIEESSRNLIETSLKVHIDWRTKRYGGVETAERQAIRSQLLEFGFRTSHVEEAMQYKDPLSFLLFNLPEDDLPLFFQKRKEDSNIKVEITKLPLSSRNSIERLMESGVSYDEALLALQNSAFNESDAAAILTESIIPSIAHIDEITEEESRQIWDQELESLSSIYEDKIDIVDKDSCFTMELNKNFNLKLKVYKSRNYPMRLPGIIVSTFNKNYKLPNYIKQQILYRLLHYISVSGLLGDMLVFHIFEWLQENLSSIIENPGPLLPLDLNQNGESQNNQRSSTKKYIKSKSHSSKELSQDEILVLEKAYKERLNSSEYLCMIKQRSKLPAWHKQDLIVDMVYRSDVILITGETGSGKSTQVAQFLLDHLMNTKKDFSKVKLLCTQPRRISAIGLAERVSDERCTPCGDEVGYIIRGTNRSGPNTRITFMTTGILVRILQGDVNFLKNKIIIIDEVHERSVETDLIVIMLKNLLGKIPGMKIVLMSATVNIDIFKQYFEGLKQCHIEGRTFPVTDYYLDDILKTLDFKIRNDRYQYENDDSEVENAYLRPKADSRFFQSGQINYDLIVDTVTHVNQRLKGEGNNGSIIVFLPGVGEINRCIEKLKQSVKPDEFVVLPLHSALTSEFQKRVFVRFTGKRKIVVSTNIAETSITIDDCVAIIDTGRAKVLNYNPKDNTTRLVETFISKAEAKQRRGRAGRVREGYSYKLFSKNIYADMLESPIPEIKRIPLESLYLSVKAMGVNDVLKFLATGIDPPSASALSKSEQMLITAGLLDDSEKSLTELGKYISILPVMDSKHGKLLIYSIIFGCTDIGVLIASVLSAGSTPFIGTFENRDKIKAILLQHKQRGDLLATVEIVRQYLSITDNTVKRKFMIDNVLSYNKIKEILSSRSQFYAILEDVGFLPMKYKPGSIEHLNKNGGNLDILKCVLTGAFYPQVARVQLPDPKFMATSSGSLEIDPEARMTKYWIRNEEYIDQLESTEDDSAVSNQRLPATRAFLHPSSVVFSSDNSTNPEKIVAMDASVAPSATKGKISPFKAPFVVYCSAHVTSKFYLNYITPTSTLALLLFGGPIRYDTNGSVHSPGIVVDNWLPIRTWCKNGVLIKELRALLDQTIKKKLDNPNTAFRATQGESQNEILDLVETVIRQ